MASRYREPGGPSAPAPRASRASRYRGQVQTTAQPETGRLPGAQFPRRGAVRIGNRSLLAKERTKMPVSTDSPAVAVALSHVTAWSNHDYETARAGLAADVTVASTTTQPIMVPVHLAGSEAYMEGLIHFAQTVVPGSARVIASTGDERNALLMLTVEADFGGGKMILPGARLYLLDDDSKIKSEQVIFFGSPE